MDTRRVLTGPQRKFCEGIVSGKTATEAYLAAYPNATPATARKNAARVKANEGVLDEIARLRAAADAAAGSAVLTLAEKRTWLARLVRSNLAGFDTDKDGDLLQSIEPCEFGQKLKLAGKIDAIKLDNDLAGEGSEAGANDALTALLARVRK